MYTININMNNTNYMFFITKSFHVYFFLNIVKYKIINEK